MSNPDDDIWIPLQTARYRLTGTDALQSISVEVSPGSTIEQAMVDIERILRRAHGILPGRDNDFAIFDRKTFFNARAEATEIFSYLLASIAGVSLVVGGIGIMNIMLVTVTERTREIGIRKAMGARRTTILMQFLVESVTLCVLGGVLGIALGAGLSMLLAKFAGWQTYVTAGSVMLSFGFAAAVGLLFGLMPALRAARLDPIEALRYE
jgi:putative ABC transport system permease protein